MTLHLATLIPEHGYGIAFLGALLEGETVLILAGLAANRGYLDWPLLIAIGAAGGFLGDQIYFAIGHHFGNRVLDRFPRFKPMAERVDAMIVRYPHLAVIGVRFTYGLRTAGPMIIGMGRMHWLQFALLNALGAIIWSTCWVGLGYLAGSALEAALGNLKHVEHVVFAVALLILAAVSVVLHLRRRRQARRP
jgi:membrane protein DedA with SNARE-associated domain